jgi:surfactin synthase thioesterase subunit
VTPVELVCFHRAGGGSASFHPLRLPLAVLGANVALTTVKLPGRESRRDEPRYVDADACVRAVAVELDGLLSAGGRFLFRQPDPQLVTAVARVAADVALERS